MKTEEVLDLSTNDLNTEFNDVEPSSDDESETLSKSLENEGAFKTPIAHESVIVGPHTRPQSDTTGSVQNSSSQRE